MHGSDAIEITLSIGSCRYGACPAARVPPELRRCHTPAFPLLRSYGPMVKKKTRLPLHGLRHDKAKPNIADRFQLAIGAHQSGQLERAAALYEDILRLQPGHSDALLLLGHLHLNCGRNQLAADTLIRALAENPGHAGAHFNLGVALVGLGKNEAALASFDSTVKLLPAYSEAFCNRGIALQNLQRHKEALTSFDQAIRHQPDNFAAHNNRGISAQKLGLHEEAIASFGTALALDAKNSAIYNNLGISLLALQRHAEALDSFDRALELLPGYAEAHNNRGLALQYLERDEEAIASFDTAIRLDAGSSMAYNNRGMSLFRLGRDAEAIASLDRALGVAPGSAEALNNRGLALQRVGRFADALACFDTAIALRQANIDALNNRGNVLRDMNRNSEALASYEAALTLAPEVAHTHLNEALCRLLLGDFARGWQEFEWRWQTDQYRPARRDFPQPLWLGKEDLQGRTILLHAEQGLGDTLQFCRYAQAVAARGATVLLEVQPALKAALTGLSGVSRILAQGEPLPEFDCHCPLLSLPLAFATTVAQIPAELRYVRANPQRVAQWQARLGERTKPRVGLAWSGNASFGNDRNRSIALEALAKILSASAHFISLQKEIRPADLPAMAAHPEIAHFGAELVDFADTAALIEQLDYVITVDTAVAHLAGALGKTVWILLPFNADWRWLLERDDTPWYPTARLFRQARLGAWDEVVARVAQELGHAL